MKQKFQSKSLLDHFQELRYRLFISVAAFSIAVILIYLFRGPLFHYLSSPLFENLPEGSRNLYFTNPLEKFMTTIKLCIVGGLLVSSPFLIFQLWRFIAPGLHHHERQHAILLTLVAALLFLLGIFFCYFFILPIGLKFLLGFAAPHEIPIITIKEYISLALKLLLIIGLGFEFPLVIVGLVKFGVVSLETLRKGRRYAIVAVFIVAAILTPPDVITQTLLALPMLALYELTLIGLRLFKIDH